MLAKFYSDPSYNHFHCVENEYVILENAQGEIVDKQRWDGDKYRQVRYKPIDNIYSGLIRPRNPQQCLAFDLMQDSKTSVKLLSGSFGSGKTMIMILHALEAIRKGDVDKLVWVRNNVEVKDSVPLGALPGLR